MTSIPAGYKQTRQGAALLFVKEPYEQLLLDMGITDPEHLLRHNSRERETRKGRGMVTAIPIAGSPGEQMLIRKYLRGGLIRHVNRDLHLDGQRPFKELAVTVAAAEAGIPTIDILAAVSIKSFGPFFRGYLISKELPACRDLPTYIETTQPADDERATLMTEVADLIRRMHEKGFFHGDLNLKNILIDVKKPGLLYIIDWDKSVRTSSLGNAERHKNIVRFCRSVIKFIRTGLPLTEKDLHRFLTAYWREQNTASPETAESLSRLRRALAVRKTIGSY